MTKMRILFLVTEDWYFWTHRRAIAQAAKDAGFEVIVATHINKHGNLIEEAGFRCVPIQLRRYTRDPFQELYAIADLVSLYRREQPLIVHHVAIQPIIYGTWAAMLTGVPAIVNALAGLGYIFVSRGKRAIFFKLLLGLALRTVFSTGRCRVIFQNPEDQAALIANRIVASYKTVLIRGAGVDLNEFSVRPEPKDTPIVMLAGRLLWNKGVGVLAEASKLLKKCGIRCRVVFVGEPDRGNPQAVDEATLKKWQQDGLVEWWGVRQDMPEVLEQSHLVVLPTTYGEGVPKILIEAAAVGRAIIATDVPGCREIVRNGENGLLIPPNDLDVLTSAIADLITDPDRRARMGRRGREIVEAEFSQEKVIAQTLSVYKELLQL